MQIKPVVSRLLSTLLDHKFFSLPLMVMLFILLMRIPLGTFSESSWIDTAAHFVLPAVGAPLLYAWLVGGSYLPKLDLKNIVLFCVLLGTSLEVGWEIVEFAVDQTLGWRWQLDNTDTMYDLVSAVVGSTAGAYLFVKLYKRA
jgi:hypothetical protein